MSKKRPTSAASFARQTSIEVWPLVHTVLGRRGFDLSPNQQSWFVRHCDLRVRSLHANNERWRKKLNGATDAGRDLVYAFVNHWLDAYVADPDTYQRQHPHSTLTQELSK